MLDSNSARRIVIGPEERSGWSSERPREGRKAHSQNRARVLSPAAELYYAPRSLLVVCSATPEIRLKFLQRFFSAQQIISQRRIEAFLGGSVDSKDLGAAAKQLMHAAISRRLQAGQSTVIAPLELFVDEREDLTKIAHQYKRTAHLIVLDAGRQAVGDENLFAQLAALRAAARSGEVGSEGFRTALVLGRADVDRLQAVFFIDPRERVQRDY